MKPTFAVWLTLVLAASSVKAENSVVVESKTVPSGKRAVKAGVYLANDIPLLGLAMPFEFREITPGAYLASRPQLIENPGGRYCHSPLGSCPSPLWPPGSNSRIYYAAPGGSDECSGPVSHTYFENAGTFDSLPPDGYLYFTVSGGCPDCGLYPLEVGADLPGTENASFHFQFDVSTTPGQFEIDTCCVRPAYHLLFLDQNSSIVVPAFTKGVITLAPCTCPCAADPVCDGAHDISDVSALINVAFRGVPDISDSTCSVSRTDVNADGQTDVADVVKMIFVAFLGQPPETYFVNPCQ